MGEGYTIAGLEVGLRALRFLETRDRTTVTELASALGVVRSRAHRIMRTLETAGFLVPARSGSGFVAGNGLISMSAISETDQAARRRNRAMLGRVRERVGESVFTAALMGDHALVLDGRRSPHEIDIGLRIGMLHPAHAMAAGKLLLSLIDEAQVVETLPATLTKEGPKTITDRSQLLAELARTRERGYAISIRESEPGVDSAAVLLSGESWRDRVALVVSVPVERGGEARMRELVEAMRDAVRDEHKARSL